MADHRPANDDSISFDDAVVLLDEIERLREALGQAEQRLAVLDRLAHRDPLVDLPNRRCLLDCLQRVLGRVHQSGGEAALLFADLDGLKTINDRFGHSVGDKALIDVSALLSANVRKADCLARIGGDEFAVLFDHTDELSAWRSALRIVEAVDEHAFKVGKIRWPLSLAVGVTMLRPGDTADEVLARADQEMYRIKNVRSRAQGPGAARDPS